MSYWLTDPELFLYTKSTGSDDVHLWRCKKPASSSSSSSSLVVPMKPDDFEYVETVTDHLELIGDLFDWEETDYKRLVKYISERRLLVNSQGFVIAELLQKADKDENKKTDDANQEDVPAIYIRSLDVLPLKPYIPNLRERPIPLRTVKYLGDVNGKASLMEGDSQVTKLTTRVDNLEAENTRLESKNDTLDTSVTQLIAGLATLTGNVVDLQSKNKTLEAENKKLTADMVTQMTTLKTLQQEVKNMNANNKEAWMNDLTNGEWVGVERLTDFGSYDNLTIVGPRGTFTVDDNSTNIRATNWYKIKLYATSTMYKAVFLEDLTPNKENARFSKGFWWSGKSKGKTFVALYSASEVWMNDLTNSDWVGIEGLANQGSWNITIVGQPGTFTMDDSSTNVRARYLYKIKFTNVEYKAVCLEDLTPDKERARFSYGVWFSFKSTDGKTYVFRWL